MSYKTSTQGTYFSQFTNDEKIAYALNLSLAKVTTDAFKAGYEWYNSPDLFNAISKQSILSDSIPKYNEINNYYCIITVNGVEYITNKTVDNILTYQGGFKLSQILGTNSEILNGTSNENSNPPTSSDFNSSGLCTKLPRQAFAYFVYWKNKLTGLGGTGNNANGTSGGLWPHSDDSLSLKLTLNSDGSNNADRTYSSVIANEDLMTKLQDYIPLKIINPSFISGNINQTNGIPENLKQYVNKKIAINVGVPTISTWNGLSNSNNSDNIAFFNPLLTKSLNEPYGYNGNGLGNGYWIRGTDSSRTNIRPDYGSSAVGEGTMIFSAMTGFILFFGVSNILTNSTGVSVKNPPCVTALRYTGETFSDGIISQGDTLPAVEVSNDKDLFINTTDNTIHRLEDNNGTKTWVGIGGGGGGGDGDMEINGVLKIKNDSTTTPENSFSIVNANDDYRFLTTLVGGSSHLYMYNAAGNIPIALSTDWHSYFNVTGGNVGIGTDFSDMSGDYGAKLTIGDYDNNYSKVSEKVYDTLRLSVKTDKSTSYHGLHWYDIQNSYMMSAIRSSVGANWNNSSLHFYTSKDRNTPTQKMSIDGDGNVNISPGNLTTTGNTIITGSVGIGTNTINDYTKLHVYGGSYISNGYFKVNDDNGNDMFWIMNGKSFFKSTIKIDHGVKIGRDTLMDPDTSGNIVCKFSNGSNSNAYLRAYYSSTKYLTLGAYSSYNFMLSTGSPLKLGGDGGYKMTLNSSGATIEGNLTVSGTVTANGETLTGGGGQHLLIDGHKWATTADYASLSYKTLNQETNGTYGLLLDSAGSTYINAYSNNHIYFLNNDVQIGVFSSSGKFGIGNIATSTMSSELEVHGSAYVSNNVGIGTNVPVAPLSICGSSSNFNESNVRGIHMGIISGNNQAAIEINGYNHAFIDFKLESGGGGNTDRHARIEYYNRKLYFETEATDRMIIDSNGRVGIGSDAPNASLDVNGSTHLDYMETSSWIYIKGATGRWPLPSTSGYRWSKTWSRTGATWVDSFPIALRIDSGSIYSQNDPVLHTNSDIRIKKDIEEVPDNLSLEMVRNIPCKYYKYIDEGRNIKNNDKKVIGFIAQEVKEVFPLAVDLVNDFEPNENRLLENISWEKITDNSNNVCKYKLTSDLQDVSGVKYKFYMVNDPSGNVPETKKEVIGNNDNTFTFDNSWNYVFCVGREINDFHALDKSKLFTLNFSATQEIDRIQQKQLLDISGNKVEIELLKLENQDLKDEIKIIKQENKALLSKLEAFEKRLENANI